MSLFEPELTCFYSYSTKQSDRIQVRNILLINNIQKQKCTDYKCSAGGIFTRLNTPLYHPPNQDTNITVSRNLLLHASCHCTSKGMAWFCLLNALIK